MKNEENDMQKQKLILSLLVITICMVAVGSVFADTTNSTYNQTQIDNLQAQVSSLSITVTLLQQELSNITLTPGLQGLKGDTGLQGLQGIQGLPGKDGLTITGPQGHKGDKGDTGLQGLQGINGSNGKDGTNGIDGVNGAIGPQGVQGIPGVKGDTGLTGLTGATGLQGIVGPQGNQGNQGFKGPKGDTGIRGVNGNNGLQGIQGIQGVKGDIGLTGAIGPQGIAGTNATVDLTPIYNKLNYFDSVINALLKYWTSFNTYYKAIPQAKQDCSTLKIGISCLNNNDKYQGYLGCMSSHGTKTSCDTGYCQPSSGLLTAHCSNGCDPVTNLCK